MKQRPQLSLEERLPLVIKALHAAFEDCCKPGVYREFFGVGGPEWGDMEKHWMPLTREEVEAMPEFDLVMYSDDLDVMSTIARRYFIPALMVWVLTHPGGMWGWEFEGFLDHLDKMWVKEESYRYSRATLLTPKQMTAVTKWCDLLLDGALRLEDEDEDDFGSNAGMKQKEKVLQRLLQLKEFLPKAVKLTDYDQDQRDEVKEAKLKAAGDWSSRRKGWKRFKGKEGQRPQE